MADLMNRSTEQNLNELSPRNVHAILPSPFFVRKLIISGTSRNTMATKVLVFVIKIISPWIPKI
jgi:hypothetical protein